MCVVVSLAWYWRSGSNVSSLLSGWVCGGLDALSVWSPCVHIEVKLDAARQYPQHPLTVPVVLHWHDGFGAFCPHAWAFGRFDILKINRCLCFRSTLKSNLLVNGSVFQP